MSSPAPALHLVDIRQLGTCIERKALVMKTFDALDEGESVVVLNDHLPRGLLAHFQEQRPGQFEWAMLESGPEVFRARITKNGSAGSR